MEIDTRRVLTFVVLIAFLVTGCTTTREIPREEFEAASKQPFSMEVVTTNDGAEYRVRSFSVTDTTFVIRELTKKDERYGTAEMPIILPLADVSTVQGIDSRPGAFLIVVPLGILVLFFATMDDIHLD